MIMDEMRADSRKNKNSGQFDNNKKFSYIC